MNRDKIEVRLDEIINAFKKTETVESLSIEDVITDSLDLMRFIVKLEEEFNVYIEVEHLLKDEIYNKDFIIGVIEHSLS